MSHIITRWTHANYNTQAGYCSCMAIWCCFQYIANHNNISRMVNLRNTTNHDNILRDTNKKSPCHTTSPSAPAEVSNCHYNTIGAASSSPSVPIYALPTKSYSSEKTIVLAEHVASNSNVQCNDTAPIYAQPAINSSCAT